MRVRLLAAVAPHRAVVRGEPDARRVQVHRGLGGGRRRGRRRGHRRGVAARRDEQRERGEEQGGEGTRRGHCPR